MNQIEKKLKFALYGYQYIDYSIAENLNFQRCLQLLSNHRRYKTEPIAQSEVIRISEKIFYDYFPNLNREVLHLPVEEINAICKTLPELDQFIALLNQEARYMDIYQLPIVYSEGLSMDGKINKLLIDTPHIEILNQARVIFSSIELGTKIDYLSVITHVHEVIHGLLERNKGSVKNYLNTELLSNFMEKAAALSMGEDWLKLAISNRLFDLEEKKNKIEFGSLTLDEIESYQYLYSGFLAEFLFDIYQKGSLFLQKQIIREISKILKGDLILEDFLESKEISYYNDDIVKCLKKTIEEKTIKL